MNGMGEEEEAEFGFMVRVVVEWSCREGACYHKI
jgi:hypothetical protein